MLSRQIRWLRVGGIRVGMAAVMAAALCGAPGVAPSARAEEAETVEDILTILLDRGIIDEATHTELTRKHRAKAKGGAPSVAAGPASILDGIEWSGDFRLRYEGFYYDEDSLGMDQDNRYRFRYRARLGLEKKVNDRFAVGLRLASGEDDHRSTNQSFGGVDEDFDPDSIFIDRAFLRIGLPEAAGFTSQLHAGKVSNPFLWKHGKDLLVWDADINPEGAFLATARKLSERGRLFASLGGFVVDEDSASKDPKVFGFQTGGEAGPWRDLGVGVRASGYEWRSLDDDFVAGVDRAMDFGNLASAFDSRARIGELSAYLRCERLERWPLELWGTAVRNFTADDAVIGGFAVDEEDTAWGLGLEIGSAKELVSLGAGFFHVEANSVVAQFTDSDLFDGFTNRRGWMFYASRRLFPNVDLNVTFFDSDSIKNTGGAAGPFATSAEDADRKRLQTDLVVSF